ncbi:MAG: DUF393 domain-containing protein [Candidatus Zixiibacteriota bacterium]
MPNNLQRELAGQNLVIDTMKQYHLIYDDNCPVCLSSVGKISKLDKLGLVNRVPLSQALKARNPNMPVKDKLAEQLHLVTPEGKIYRGAEAVGILATLFPQSRLLGQFMLLPGVRFLARAVYRLIARHRMRLSRLMPLN